MGNIGSSERPDLPFAAVIGAGGMAMAAARRLGQTHRLLLVDRNSEHLGAQAAALRGEGHDVATAVCDVSQASDVEMVAERARSLGPVRILAHVVGLSPSMGDFRTLMSVNLVGAHLVADAFLPIIAAGGCGLFVSSMAGHLRSFPALEPILDAPLRPDFLEQLEAALTEPANSTLAYMLSKSALNRMVRRRASAWGARGARILSLSPGMIATPQGAFEFERTPAKYDMLEKTPFRREGTMLEIADAIEFLTSSKASFISGTDLLVDGGLTGTLRNAVP